MNPQDAWNTAFNQLELQFDRATFDTWLRPLVLIGYENGRFILGAHNGYARDMLQHRLYRNIRRVLSDVCGQQVELQFEVHKTRSTTPAPATDDTPLFRLLAQQPIEDETGGPLHERVSMPERPTLPESELNPRFTFTRFVSNKSSQVAYEAARAVAEYPASVYNPLLIYGGVGLGKTHILQAVANMCHARGLRTIYIPSEVFMNDLIHAIRNRATAMFRDKYRTVDVLLVDDIQFIAGKETTQEEFFHTFNALVNFNKQIVLACDRHPRELTELEDRLRSRFQGGLLADIQPPELETRIAILEMWAREREVSLPQDIMLMVAERAADNVRTLEGQFNQIVAEIRLSRTRPLSIQQAERMLARYESPRNHSGQVTLARIVAAVSHAYNLNPQDLTGKRRSGRINLARQVAIFLARELTDCSLQQIGEALGGRSHTTVLHSYNKMLEAMAMDDILSRRVEKIRRSIAAPS